MEENHKCNERCSRTGTAPSHVFLKDGLERRAYFNDKKIQKIEDKLDGRVDGETLILRDRRDTLAEKELAKRGRGQEFNQRDTFEVVTEVAKKKRKVDDKTLADSYPDLLEEKVSAAEI
ncbi:hypothetical protein HDU86_002801 [Geranomyces michiganensis]|nr:hypothetical protein HDU86_002801 [Geranomyces michiganensis]